MTLPRIEDGQGLLPAHHGARGTRVTSGGPLSPFAILIVLGDVLLKNQRKLLFEKALLEGGSFWIVPAKVCFFFCPVQRQDFLVVVVVQSLSYVQLLQPHRLYPTRLLCPWDSPGKNTGVGCHFLLQGIFSTQESNPGLRPCRQILDQLNYESRISQLIMLDWESQGIFPFFFFK